MRTIDGPEGDSGAGTGVPEVDVDVVVIGGGPAGTTVGTLLVDKGWRVVLLEQDRHPRFHIGESLLPMNVPIFKRLGVLEQVRRIGVVKLGAELCPAGAGVDPRTAYFSDALEPSSPFAFQVRRDQFDEMLFRTSAERGVVALEGVRVRDVRFGEEGRHQVEARDADGNTLSWSARFVVDASGRDTFLSRKLNLKRKNPRHNTAAVFAHFRDVVRRPGADEGNIGLYWFADGWFWMIPLPDGLMSVGAVCPTSWLKRRTCGLEDFLQQTIDLCPEVRERMADARIEGPARATGNYSYTSSRMWGKGWLLLGDAFAFVDPVFSTGVYFAMHGAEMAADAIDAHLRDARSAAPAFRRFEKTMTGGIRTISWFIYRFTSPTMQYLFMKPRNAFRMRQAVVSMLAGDLFRDTPIRLPLALFRCVYAVRWLAEAPRALAAWRRSRREMADGFSGGTLSVDRT